MTKANEKVFRCVALRNLNFAGRSLARWLAVASNLVSLALIVFVRFERTRNDATRRARDESGNATKSPQSNSAAIIAIACAFFALAR